MILELIVINPDVFGFFIILLINLSVVLILSTTRFVFLGSLPLLVIVLFKLPEIATLAGQEFVEVFVLDL